MTRNNLSTPTLVTCGLPYANGDLHIGHLRGLIAGDAYARAVRQAGGTAVYVSGSDVHGTPIALAADGDPRSFALSYHEQFQQQFPALGIDLDAYGHTDTERNIETTHNFIHELVRDGAFNDGPVSVAIDTKTGAVLPDRYVEGDCPECRNTARGDECEHCGRHLEPGDVQNPISTRTGEPARYEERSHGFIDLPSYESDIRSFIQRVSGSSQVQDRTEEWLADGLRPWCITRDLSWGVTDPTNNNRVLYVWVDALSEYVSATKLYSSQPEAEFDWRDIWVDGEGDIVHIIGKDIIQHHTTLWPALLTSAEFTLPSAVLASGFVTLDGAALSTSRNHAVWAQEYTDTGWDSAYLRHYLLSQSAFDSDVDFTWEHLQETANNALVNTVGNFLYRVSGIGHNGKIAGTTASESVIEHVADTSRDYKEAVETYDIRTLATTPVELARYGNKNLQRHEPWNKTGEKRKQAIADAGYIARATLSFLYPVAPTTATDIANGFFSDGIAKVGSVPRSGSIRRINRPFDPIENVQNR